MGSNILAIEDDRDALTNLCDILELDGYTVTGAGTLKEAMQGHTWSDFSVVLLDRRLPDANADTLLPQIRAAAPNVGLIVITGYADLEGTIAALRSGAADYLLKPINPDLLRTAVARVLKLQEMEQRTLQSERLAAIGQMIAVLTHESGNALARSQVLLANLAEEVQDRPGAIELLAHLQKAQGDLRRLYEEVRNYAAPIKLEFMPWDIGAIWRQAWAKVIAAHSADQAAVLSENIRGVDLVCETDNFRLDQVFRNLFENSVAACSKAKIEIACTDATLNGRPALRIAVRHNGPGLKAADLLKVFAPFYTTKKKGTGLGMAIVKRIVEAHGGEITVGEPVQGAEFILTLPRSRSAGAEFPFCTATRHHSIAYRVREVLVTFVDARPKSPHATELRSRKELKMSRPLRIAIADDEPVFLSFVRKMLKSLGHEVISQSQNGIDLVDQCRLLSPDLIITDVAMPELDGLEAARTINKEQRIPVILASSQLDLDDLGRDVNYVVARLPKPIDTDQLAAAIRSAFPSCDGD